VSSPTQTLSQRFDPKLLAALEGLDFKARYVMEGFLSGLHDSPFHGFSVEFSDYRNYQPGDDLRHLDWRLYARSDRLCIKRYMLETNVRFYVVCDSSASMKYRGTTAWASKLECAKILSGALTWFLLRQNDAAGMVNLNNQVSTSLSPSDRGKARRGALLAALQRGTVLHNSSALLNVPTNSASSCANLKIFSLPAAHVSLNSFNTPFAWYIVAASFCSFPIFSNHPKTSRWVSNNFVSMVTR